MADRGTIVGIATLGDEASWVDSLNLHQAIVEPMLPSGDPGSDVSINLLLKLGLTDAEQGHLVEYFESLQHREKS